MLGATTHLARIVCSTEFGLPVTTQLREYPPSIVSFVKSCVSAINQINPQYIMVRLVVKRGDEPQFLLDTTLEMRIEPLLFDIVAIFNGRLKVQRICGEIEELAKYGPMFKPEIIGLTEEQVAELKLVDEWIELCVPSGGYTLTKDPVGRRFGHQPVRAMQDVLLKAVAEAKQLICPGLVAKGQILTQKDAQRAIDLLRGAVTIVYPMQLPPHDPIRMEFSNIEELSGTYAAKEIVEPAKAQLWFAGHHMLPEKALSHYLGRNEKCKVIVKLAKSEEGQPSREPSVSEEERKQLMMHAYKRQEELKVSQEEVE